MSKEIQIFDFTIFNKNLSEVGLNKRCIINTINGYSYSVAKNNSSFRQALKDSDILLPDGASIVFGVKVMRRKNITKIAGYDIFIHLLTQLEKTGGSCFFLGSMDSTLKKIDGRLKVDFPNVTSGYYSPPYKTIFSEEDNHKMLNAIKSFSPDVLFVGMTAPKQEMWVHNNNENISARIICSIGAVFDFYAGSTKRPPQWLIKMNLEWLGRLLKEPRRMWKRYLISTPVFFIDVFLYKLGLSKEK